MQLHPRVPLGHFSGWDLLWTRGGGVPSLRLGGWDVLWARGGAPSLRLGPLAVPCFGRRFSMCWRLGLTTVHSESPCSVSFPSSPALPSFVGGEAYGLTRFAVSAFSVG